LISLFPSLLRVGVRSCSEVGKDVLIPPSPLLLIDEDVAGKRRVPFSSFLRSVGL